MAVFVEVVEADPTNLDAGTTLSIVLACLTMWMIVLLPLRLLVRSCVSWAVGTGLTARRAVLAGGDPQEALRVLRGIETQKDCDVKVCAFFDDRADDRVPDLLFEVPKIGRFDDLVAFCQLSEIDLVIVTLPISAQDRIEELMEQLSVLPVAIHLSQASSDFSFPDTRGLGVVSATFHAERRVTKRLFDVVVGGAALIALSLPMLAIALAVKLTSKGPVFFEQKRHGFNNRVIRVLKFRSMYVDQCDHAATKVVTKGDPRVTPVGRIIRKASLDELPQLFNVLNGTLSLVGPRPHAVEALSSEEEPFTRLVQNYSARHRLPPGITGLAQVNGYRGEIRDPEQLRARVDSDLRYIENWSIWMDIQILMRTPLALLNTENAY
ncbi:MAG: exopolysaccharide biosynthesis polyprenyl glycosylphosphotransferase [Pseudomonadota bacterium]